MKLGKKPARPGAIKLKFRKYANFSVLPTPPAEFGHDGLITEVLGILGNDDWGDCFFAGGAHQVMLWKACAGIQTPFTDASVLSDYSACTGFDPKDPSTDQGTDMQQGAAYFQKTGLLDANGVRHQVGAYLEITPGDIEEMLTAAYLFETVGIGLQFPSSAMDQFNKGEPWSVVPGSSIEGGHYVPFFARRAGMTVVATWGAEESATDEFLQANNDESIVYIDAEMLTGGKSLEGFDLEQLNADLNELQTPSS